MNDPRTNPDPHAGQVALRAGDVTHGVIILLHGRGGTAGDILALGRDLAPPGVGLVAVPAAGNTWYPKSFLAPVAENQPFLDSALRRVESEVASLLASGLDSRRVAIMGFSQGACLALEYVARHPRRYAAAVGLTGGLIGPPGTPRSYPGSLAGTPVFLGANDPDPHVPFARIQETAATLTGLGAAVELRRYPGLPHAVNDDEAAVCRRLFAAAFTNSQHEEGTCPRR
jgi:phospholipase/carboxylesterase